jgi:hypothetical protein
MASSTVRSLICVRSTFPSSSFRTTTASISLTTSLSLSRSSSARICPSNFGSLKPTTSSWTGPVSGVLSGRLSPAPAAWSVIIGAVFSALCSMAMPASFFRGILAEP